jgi:hypothetical protein
MNIETEIKEITRNSVFMSVYCKIHSCIHSDIDKQVLQDACILSQRVRTTVRNTVGEFPNVIVPDILPRDIKPV